MYDGVMEHEISRLRTVDECAELASKLVTLDDNIKDAFLTYIACNAYHSSLRALELAEEEVRYVKQQRYECP